MNHVNSPRTDDDAIEREIVDKGKTAPRVTPADIDAAIDTECYFTAGQGSDRAGTPHDPALDLLTFCVLTLRNGFIVTGESACASPENFDAAIGRKIARENAKQKVWPLLGFRLKDKLSGTNDDYGDMVAYEVKHAGGQWVPTGKVAKMPQRPDGAMTMLAIDSPATVRVWRDERDVSKGEIQTYWPDGSKRAFYAPPQEGEIAWANAPRVNETEG